LNLFYIIYIIEQKSRTALLFCIIPDIMALDLYRQRYYVKGIFEGIYQFTEKVFSYNYTMFPLKLRAKA